MSGSRPSEFDADAAIVGAGPVGLAAALALADAGQRVLLIESGGARFDAAAQTLGDAEIVDPSRHAPMALATRRAFGGTSALWGGRAVPFDPQDFEPRPAAPGASWPIGADAALAHLGEACALLDCGPPAFGRAWPGAQGTLDGLDLTRLERWCAQPDLRKARGRAARHERITVLLDTTVVAVEIGEGRAASLRALRDGAELRLSPRSIVLACGGLETARLLLASREDRPQLFGGPDGALGRFYMGHLFGSIADLVFLREGADAEFLFAKDGSGRYARRRLALDAATQARLGLLNMAAWPEPPPIHDSRHGDAILSLAFLALAAPLLGPRLAPEAIRLRKIGPAPRRVAPHLWNALRGAPRAAAFAARFLAARYGSDVRLPGFFILNRARRYELHHHAEHLPRADSRATLSDARDALGRRRLRVDLRFGVEDARSVVGTIEAMAERLSAAGLARVEWRVPPEARIDAVLAQASDGFHQIGTARMSRDPRQGVVDADARVHGVANLFLAGSAIFPSSGQANPTLTAVALALRLAAHLKAEQLRLPEAA